MFVRSKFKACIGVAISFENPSKFKSAYTQFFEELKKHYSVDSPRYAFKSYDLKMFFPFEKYPSIVENFIECVLDAQTHVNFVFSSFNTQKMPKVQYYVGYKKKQVKEKKTIDFLDSLGAYYSYIAAWKVVREADLKLVDVHIDHFEGERTLAWDELNKHNKVVVFPKGDQCNPFISAADIILDYINYRMRTEDIRLDRAKIADLLHKMGIERSSAFHSGGQDIKHLVPKTDEKIPRDSNCVCPLVYVINEGLITKETRWIENSPMHQILLRFASDIGSGLKYINFDKDYKNVRDGDYLIYLGEEGKRKAEYLAGVLGYPFKVIGLKDIVASLKDRKEDI